ncbi:MAG: hypothetical protein JWM54_1599, partial [Acidobacteriaceae bacterium]|nr:hypothetical protein [Acidobacteriaceae bacterium]
GDFDHFGVDVEGKRVFVAAEEGKSVEVFDSDGKHLHSITGFGQPHAMVYLPSSNRLIVTDGDDFGAVELVDAKDYKVIKSLKLPPGADGAIFNPVNQVYYVESKTDQAGADSNQLNLIDARTFTLMGKITLPGSHSQGMAVSGDGKLLYVNLTGADEVGVVDLSTRSVISRWRVPGATIGNSMALDEPNHRLFIATRNPAKFFAFDTTTGKVVTVLPCSSMNDDMWWDAATRRLYLTGTDAASVIQQVDPDHYRSVGEVPTGYRAKTSIFVRKWRRLYVAVSGKLKPGARLALQVYDVEP